MESSRTLFPVLSADILFYMPEQSGCNHQSASEGLLADLKFFSSQRTHNPGIFPLRLRPRFREQGFLSQEKPLRSCSPVPRERHFLRSL